MGKFNMDLTNDTVELQLGNNVSILTEDRECEVTLSMQQLEYIYNQYRYLVNERTVEELEQELNKLNDYISVKEELENEMDNDTDYNYF